VERDVDKEPGHDRTGGSPSGYSFTSIEQLRGSNLDREQRRRAG
jgi:hypothetical protein